MKTSIVKDISTLPFMLLKRGERSRMALAFVLMSVCLCVGAQTYEEHIQTGLTAAEEERYADAEEAFRMAIKSYPDDYRNSLAYANIAHVQEAQGQNLKALASYDSAVELAPKNVPIRKSRADLYMKLGNYGKAIIDYNNIIELAPNNTDALLARAYIYLQRRDYDKARSDYERLLSILPDNYAALFGTAMMLQGMGKPQDALTRLSVLIDKYPRKAELFVARAEIESDAKQYELAQIDLDQAILLEPNNRNTILTRAYLHLNQGNGRLARQDFERAIELGVPRNQLKDELKKCKKK